MGKLYIVATPIGNLEDITLRAIRILKEADLILCEDTRQTKKLVNYYKISTPLLSYHQHSKFKRVESILEKLKMGKSLALVSDAGTPGISDPGNKLIEEVVEKLPATEVFAIPGPSAVMAALSISGLPTDKFNFLGFIPHKKGRQTLFKHIAESKVVSVFYESTHRIIKTLEQLGEHLDEERRVVVARELTKKFETAYRGGIKEVLQKLSDDTTKGEFVVVVEGKK